MDTDTISNGPTMSFLHLDTAVGVFCVCVCVCVCLSSFFFFALMQVNEGFD